MAIADLPGSAFLVAGLLRASIAVRTCIIKAALLCRSYRFVIFP